MTNTRTWSTLLYLNTISERFGLVLAEANAVGVPVTTMDLVSCREMIKDGQTGFLVNNVDEAVRTEAYKRVYSTDETPCKAGSNASRGDIWKLYASSCRKVAWELTVSSGR